ncbi:MAG: alpha/beta hydrolase [Rhodospirillales bacterium]|nr:alpha/beta hydrolase [Rhodospirillales bacterium]MCB9996669.1 alpha/beta hydrolase [Rhodospirillales bacterium]
MKTNALPHPDLEDRFLMPPGWRWHMFKNSQGRDIRFGSVAPESGIPDAVVIVLQGMGEFTEKYFELAHDLLKRNLSFWMIDWQGQGKSHRYLKDPHKRHSGGFSQDVDDLHYFIMEYVKHSAVHPDVGRIPLVMLGHSTGANIGLRYLQQYPEMFTCAAFTAPLIGLSVLKPMPSWLSRPITAAFKEAMDQSYAGIRDRQWRPEMRDATKNDIHSSDPARKAVHNSWCQFDPALQVGQVTYGWLHEANISCLKLQKKGFLETVETPCLFALAGKDRLVDNAAARKAIARMPNARIQEIPGAKHEILMETDDIRNRFLEAFDELLKSNNLKEKLKPF